MKLAQRFLSGVLIAIVLILGLVNAPSTFAQDTPEPIRNVMINDLQARFGVQGRPSSWRHTVETSSDSNLGCPLLEAGNPLPNVVNVYVVTLNYGSTQYTYRISEDRNLVVVCDQSLLENLGVGVAQPPESVGIDLVSCDPARSSIVLTVGALGRVTLPDLTLFQDLDPSSAIVATLPTGSPLTMVDGPFCDSELVWWLVNATGLLGYTYEVNYVQHIQFIEIAAGDAGNVPPPQSNTGVAGFSYTSATCPADFAGYLPPRLIPGFQGRVEGGGINNIIRANYGRSANYLTEMPPGTVFDVIGGPECTGANLGEAIVWFQVNWNGTVGWTAESFNGDYYVEALVGDAGSEIFPGAIQPDFNTPSGLPRYTLPTTSGSPINLTSAPGVGYQGALQLANPGGFLNIGTNNVMVLGIPEGFEAYQLSAGGGLEPLYAVGFQEPSLLFDLSADGTTIATTRGLANAGNLVVLYDAVTGTEKSVIDMGVIGSIGDVELNADGSLLAIAYQRGTSPVVEVVNVASGVRASLPHSADVTNLAFTADSGALATYSWSTDQIVVWSLRDNTQLAVWQSQVTISPDPTRGAPPLRPAMTFNSTGTQLAIGGAQGTVEVWSLIGQNQVNSFTVYGQNSGAVQALAFSPDNNVLVAAGGAFAAGPNQPDEPLMFFNLTNGQVIQTLTTPRRNTTHLALTPDGSRLFTLTGFDTLLIFGAQ